MIIFVNPPRTVKSESVRELLLKFMDIIFIIYRTSAHRLVIDPDFIDWIRDEFGFSGEDAQILKRMELAYATSGGVVDAGIPFISVVEWGGECETSLTGYTIGAKRFTELKLYRETRVVVENATNDGDVLRIFIKAALADQEYGVPALEFVNGGGSGLAEEFSRQLREGHITVSLFDSDKKYPEDSDSPKLGLCRNALNKSDTKLGLYIQIPCHEIENMIPYSLMADLIHNSGALYELLRKIEGAEVLAGVPTKERFKLFFDCKNGATGLHDGTPSKKKIADYVVGRLKLAGKDISEGKVDGFGPAALELLVESPVYLGRLRRDISACQYWNNIFLPEFRKMSPYLIGGDASQAL